MPRCTSVITVVVAMHVFVVTCSAADIDMFCTESTPLGVLNCSGLVPPSDRDGTSSTPLPRSTAGASMHLRTTSDPLAEDDRSIVLPPIIIQEFQFGPFAAVDLSGSMLEWIPQFSFRNLTTGLLDLSDNRLSLITEDMFSGICVSSIHIYPRISRSPCDCFPHISVHAVLLSDFFFSSCFQTVLPVGHYNRPSSQPNYND